MIRKLLNGWEAYEIWICPRCLPRIRQPGSADFALSLLLSGSCGHPYPGDA